MGSIWIQVEGGLANQLFAWAAVEVLQRTEGIRSSVYLDVRKAQRGLGAHLVLADLGLAADVLPMHPFEAALWRSGRHFLGDRLMEKAAAYIQPLPPARSALVANNYDSLFEILRHDPNANIWVRSYLQTPSALMPHRQMLSDKLLTALNRALQQRTAPELTEDVTVHVRRGDYLVERNVQLLGVCSAAYYLQGIQSLAPAAGSVRVVTDDPDWCKKELVTILNRQGYSVTTQNSSQLDDFWTLLTAQRLVLSNSTFSWWGAFAGGATEVIAPDPWFNVAGGGNQLHLEGWSYLAREVSHV